MGWVDKPHQCSLPLYSHGSSGRLGAWFECDYCKRAWRVCARAMSDQESFYNLTFVYRFGDMNIYRSWSDK